MGFRIIFCDDLETSGSRIAKAFGSIVDARLPVKVIVNGEYIPPISQKSTLPQGYNDLLSIYQFTKDAGEFLTSDVQTVELYPEFLGNQNKLLFSNDDGDTVKIAWEYTRFDYERTAVIPRPEFVGEIQQTGREFVDFARNVVFPYAEENPLWAREYGASQGVAGDRPHIDDLEETLDEVAEAFDSAE